ncbi:MAG: hypothetical protein HN494_15065 [Opitutae bacterium]|jgi:hypothetical protein|nr:hypothetical protein [Opitutae bacterium]MBT5910952.1 hypothetical protein [Opitutae bacterium]MBT7743009.1 hypothetical protein [Opitutae bacterium]
MKERIFKIITIVVGIYHVTLGALGLILPLENVVSVVKAMKGYNLEVTSQLLPILKFTSAYLLTFGAMMLLLSSNPQKYRLFSLPALVLFGTSFLNNIWLFNEIAPHRSENTTVVTLTFILFFFLSILFTMPKKQTES